jgi:hypothetical protein
MVATTLIARTTHPPAAVAQAPAPENKLPEKKPANLALPPADVQAAFDAARAQLRQSPAWMPYAYANGYWPQA